MPINTITAFLTGSHTKKEEVDFLKNNPDTFIKIIFDGHQKASDVFKDSFTPQECLDLLKNAQAKKIKFLSSLGKIIKLNGSGKNNATIILNELLTKLNTLPENHLEKKAILDNEILIDIQGPIEPGLFSLSFSPESPLLLYLLAETESFDAIWQLLWQTSPKLIVTALNTKYPTENGTSALEKALTTWEKADTSFLSLLVALNALPISIANQVAPDFIKGAGSIFFKTAISNGDIIPKYRRILVEFYLLSPSSVQDHFRSDATLIEKTFTEQERQRASHKTNEEKTCKAFLKSMNENKFIEEAVPYIINNPQFFFNRLRVNVHSLFQTYIHQMAELRSIPPVSAQESENNSNALSLLLANAYKENLRPLALTIDDKVSFETLFKQLSLLQQDAEIISKPSLITALVNKKMWNTLEMISKLLISRESEKTFFLSFDANAWKTLVTEKNGNLIKILIDGLKIHSNEHPDIFIEHMESLSNGGFMPDTLLAEKLNHCAQALISIHPSYFFKDSKYDMFTQNMITESGSFALSEKQQPLLDCILNFLSHHPDFFVSLFKKDFLLAEIYFNKLNEEQKKRLAEDKAATEQKKGFFNQLLTLFLNNILFNHDIHINLPQRAEMVSVEDGTECLNEIGEKAYCEPVYYGKRLDKIVIKYKNPDGNAISLASLNPGTQLAVKRPFTRDQLSAGAFDPSNIKMAHHTEKCQQYLIAHFQLILIAILTTREEHNLARHNYWFDQFFKLIDLNFFNLLSHMYYTKEWVLRDISYCPKQGSSQTAFDLIVQKLPSSKVFMEKIMNALYELNLTEQQKTINQMFGTLQATMQTLKDKEPNIAKFLFDHLNDEMKKKLASALIIALTGLVIQTGGAPSRLLLEATPPPPYTPAPQTTSSQHYPSTGPDKTQAFGEEENPGQLVNHQIAALNQAFQEMKKQMEEQQKQLEALRPLLSQRPGQAQEAPLQNQVSPDEIAALQHTIAEGNGIISSQQDQIQKHEQTIQDQQHIINRYKETTDIHLGVIHQLQQELLRSAGGSSTAFTCQLSQHKPSTTMSSSPPSPAATD